MELETLPKKTWAFAEDDEIAAGLHAVRLLGGGTRHEAYLAWHDRLHSLVVVKLLRPDFVGEHSRLPPCTQRARRSPRSPIRDFPASSGDPTGERPHLVIEHLDGPRLSTVIRRYRPALEQAIPLALGVCSARHYLREERWLHLDVKPKNVILGSPPRLIDLNVARRAETISGISAPVGTDAYMAPEQCDPARFGLIGPATDMWGLGSPFTRRSRVGFRLPSRTPPRPRSRLATHRLLPHRRRCRETSRRSSPKRCSPACPRIRRSGRSLASSALGSNALPLRFRVPALALSPC